MGEAFDSLCPEGMPLASTTLCHLVQQTFLFWPSHHYQQGHVEVLPLMSARPEHPRALGQRGGVKLPGGEGCWDTLSQEESNCIFGCSPMK